MKHSQKHYLKLARRALLKISSLEGKNATEYLRQKRKAEKYLEKAKKV